MMSRLPYIPVGVSASEAGPRLEYSSGIGVNHIRNEQTLKLPRLQAALRAAECAISVTSARHERRLDNYDKLIEYHKRRWDIIIYLFVHLVFKLFLLIFNLCIIL